MPDVRRLLVLVLPGLLPWSVVTWSGGFYLVFAVGWTGRGLSGFQWLPTVLAATVGTAVRPWLVATLLYGLALASAAVARVGREDRRVTAGLLFFAGASVLFFSLRTGAQRGVLALPLGTVTLWAAAAAVHRGWHSWLSAAVRRVVAGGESSDRTR